MAGLQFVPGPTQLAPSQGEGNWDLVPGACVRDQCVSKIAAANLSQEALTSLVP